MEKVSPQIYKVAYVLATSIFVLYDNSHFPQDRHLMFNVDEDLAMIMSM